MENIDNAIAVPEALAAQNEQMFPILTPAQIERVAAHGRVRQISQGLQQFRGFG